MDLAIDIGNSNIVIGAYPADAAEDAPPVACWRLTTDRERTEDEWRLLLRQMWRERDFVAADFTSAALSSVVAPLTDLWRRMLGDLLETQPMVVGPKLVLGLTLGVEHPERLGTDRLVDAVAAHRRWGGPCIAVDFGTATSFNVVDANGCFVGGAIAPGLGTVAGALVERANALPAVELSPPAHAIGRDTVPAIQSGLIYGYVGLVESLLGRIRAELDGPAPAVATGGFGHIIAPLTDAVDAYDPWLTLAGIRMLHRLNRI